METLSQGKDPAIHEHHRWMEEALAQATEALAAREVPVGCVLVAAGEKVAWGRNRTNETKNGTRHAELEAIDMVLRHCHQDIRAAEEVGYLNCGSVKNRAEQSISSCSFALPIAAQNVRSVRHR
jgi:tRNA(Arg) A34 adenosine deaminase TadA